MRGEESVFHPQMVAAIVAEGKSGARIAGCVAYSRFVNAPIRAQGNPH